MKGLYLSAIATLGSYFLGARAEFLHPWGVVERLCGRSPSAGESILARRLGAAGELVCVLLVNLLLGIPLARWLGLCLGKWFTRG